MATKIQQIFSEVPDTYELINHILTFGMDILWRKRAVKRAVSAGGTRWLDMCTGTGETAVYLRRKTGSDVRITAVDFTRAMLMKLAEKPDSESMDLVQGNARCLPFPDNHFDLITISFATRNINVSRDIFLDTLREFHRVLTPGGHFINLETSQPESTLIRRMFHGFVKLLVKPVGWLISGSHSGYIYLATTIPRFHDAPRFAEIIREAGFKKVSYEKMLLGAVAIHDAVK